MLTTGLHERRSQVPARLELFSPDAVLVVHHVRRQKRSPLALGCEPLFARFKGGHGDGDVGRVKQDSGEAAAKEPAAALPLVHQAKHSQGGRRASPLGESNLKSEFHQVKRRGDE